MDGTMFRNFPVVSASLVALVVPASAIAQTIDIKEAVYGRLVAKAPTCDAAEAVRYFCQGSSSCSFPIDDSICGDPDPGITKKLMVRYACGGTSRTVIQAESITAGDEPLEIKCTD
jgi:hypothetical protein